MEFFLKLGYFKSDLYPYLLAVTAFSSYLFAYTIHWCTSQRVSVFFSTLYLLILLKFIYFRKILTYYSPVPLFSLGRNPKNIESVG